MYGKVILVLYFAVPFTLWVLLFEYLRRKEDKFKQLHEDIKQFLREENQFLGKREE